MHDPYVIVFDGVCNFCNGAVNFIIKRDHNDRFVFVPMQSLTAQHIIAKYKVTRVGVDTFLLVKNETCFYRTNAALEIAKELSGGWFLFGVFKIIPRPIRDYFYRLFARNRYRLFGKTEVCMVPNDDIKRKFLS